MSAATAANGKSPASRADSPPLTATVFDIKRFAVHDGDGIRTTVFLKGCPMRCAWCHNPEGLSARPQLAWYRDTCVSCLQCLPACPQGAHTAVGGRHAFVRSQCTVCGRCADACPNGALVLYGKTVTADRLLPILCEDSDFYRNSGGGVTLSGGECLLQYGFCAQLLRRLKERGIHTAVDTCGDVPKDAIDAVLPYTDVFLYDIKAIDPSVHMRCTGRPNRRILDNLHYIDAQGNDIEIRIPYVPGYNDGQMDKIAACICGLRHLTKVRLLPYHRYAASKYSALGMPDTLPPQLPSDAELADARALLRAYGLPVAD